MQIGFEGILIYTFDCRRLPDNSRCIVKRSSSVLVCLLTLVLANGIVHCQQTISKHESKNEAEIKALYDRWAKAFEARDIDGIMSVYAPGDSVVGYDIAPPLQYKGKDAYRKDYIEFLDQFDGPLHVEYRT